jgi:plasmid stabilization system protein ParE
METTAVSDLYEILNYITIILKAPESAECIYLSVKQKIFSLSQMPARHNIVKDEQYASIGIRILTVENYNVLYTVDEIKQKGYVLRILHSRRIWQNLL